MLGHLTLSKTFHLVSIGFVLEHFYCLFCISDISLIDSLFLVLADMVSETTVQKENVVQLKKSVEEEWRYA